MTDGPTKFIESNAILAAQEGDEEEVKRLVRELLPGEQQALRRAALFLIRSIDNWGKR